MTDHPEIAQFFDRYAAALLARDERAVAELYAVPGLILFPGQSLPVTSRDQTAAFFAGSWAQYEGVHDVDQTIVVVLSGPGTVWADVTWTYDGTPRERFCYQLVEDQHGWQIAVLTLGTPELTASAEGLARRDFRWRRACKPEEWSAGMVCRHSSAYASAQTSARRVSLRSRTTLPRAGSRSTNWNRGFIVL